MLIKIGICDDEPSVAQRIEEIVDEYFDNSTYGHSVKKFSDPVELLDYLEVKENFDILILDVYMPMMLGTEVAKELRDRGDQTRVIFLTSSTEHAIDAFAVRASDYLLKPAKREAVFKTLDEITSQLAEREKKLFSVRTADGFVNILVHTITFIELLDRRLCIHIKNREDVLSRVIRENFEDSIKEILADSNFVQCQKSYVVNMNHVKAMNAERFIMRDGVKIPISKKFYHETKKRYMDFLLREEI